MCGYAQRIAAERRANLRAYLDYLKIGLLPDGRFFPGTMMSGVLIEREGVIEAVDATWWFLLEDRGDGTLKPNRKLSTFNARNLDNRLWNAPLKTSRCVIPATAIVETKGGKSYLMDAPDGLLLGGLYRTWAAGDSLVYSCTVITCPPHPRFSAYHDKSIPLLLPFDEKLLSTWLDPEFQDVDFFRGMIDAPRLPVDLEVTPVKNSQTLAPLGEPEILQKD